MLSRVNWKKSLVVGAMSATIFVGSTTQAFAAENFFQKAQHSFSSAMDSIYLKLPGKKPGKLVVKQMNESYKKLKSFESDTTLDMKLSGNGEEVGTAQLKVSGDTVVGEVWNPQSYKQDMKLTGNVSFQGTTLNAAAEMKMLDGVTYLKITTLPALPGANFDQVKNQWIKFDPAANKDVNKDDLKLTAEQQQKLQDAFMKMIESSTVSEAKPEKKDNVDVYVLDMTVSKPAVVDYLMTITDMQMEVMKKAAKTDEEKAALEKKSSADMKKEYEKALESVGEIKANVWVERKNYFPKHFELPLDVDVKKLSEESARPSSARAATPEVDKMSLKVVSNMSKYNESFTVTAPEGAEDAEKFFQRMMGPSAGMGTTGSPMVAPGEYPPTPSGRMYRPNVGTNELPDLTPEQRKQLEQYQKNADKMEKMNY